MLSAEPRWGEGEVCEECQVRLHAKCEECQVRLHAKKTPFDLVEKILHSGEVWADHSKAPLSPLWTPSLFKVQCQGDAHNQVQPQQAGIWLLTNFGIIKPLEIQVRVCDVCADLLTLGVGAGGNPF